MRKRAGSYDKAPGTVNTSGRHGSIPPGYGVVTALLPLLHYAGTNG
jgi:hypothetical protein